MTIATTTSRADYLGTGSAGPFAFNSKIFAATDLVVTQRDTTGLETTLAYPAAYSVAGVGGATCSVTLTTGQKFARATFLPGLYPFNAGDLVRVLVVTDAGWLPTANNLDAMVEVET